MSENERQLDWTCADCGNRDGFRDVVYDTPGEPREYDMECTVCESKDVRENAHEAAHALGDKLDVVRAELVELEKRRGDVMAGCDIERNGKIYRQVEVVFGHGKTQAQMRVDGLEAELGMLRRGLLHIAETCVQDPDAAQFALRLIDGSAQPPKITE